MSSMNFMEKLLDEVEVGWKALGVIATITIGEFFLVPTLPRQFSFPRSRVGMHTEFE